MQTFLPHPCFLRSASVLDRARLGKQRVEGFQILKTLLFGGGWTRHPAVKMWRGHAASLAGYTVAVCNEWTSRGYADSVRAQVCGLIGTDQFRQGRKPPWLGDDRFHSSHRSNLKRKDPIHYALFPEGPGIPYFWPTKNGY
jgi:hypothetical protein